MTKTPHKLNMHAKKRAEERYGINLNKHARREIVQMIQSNSDQAKFVAKESNNRSLWQVSYQDTNLNVVYDKQRETLCTVLPKDAAVFQTDYKAETPSATICKEDTRQQITDDLKKLWLED